MLPLLSPRLSCEALAIPRAQTVRIWCGKTVRLLNARFPLWDLGNSGRRNGNGGGSGYCRYAATDRLQSWNLPSAAHCIDSTTCGTPITHLTFTNTHPQTHDWGIIVLDCLPAILVPPWHTSAPALRLWEQTSQLPNQFCTPILGRTQMLRKNLVPTVPQKGLIQNSTCRYPSKQHNTKPSFIESRLIPDFDPDQALTPLALTSPFSPIFSAMRQSGQYHLVVRAGMSSNPTHSRWNHSDLQFCLVSYGLET